MKKLLLADGINHKLLWMLLVCHLALHSRADTESKSLRISPQHIFWVLCSLITTMGTFQMKSDRLSMALALSIPTEQSLSTAWELYGRKKLWFSSVTICEHPKWLKWLSHSALPSQGPICRAGCRSGPPSTTRTWSCWVRAGGGHQHHRGLEHLCCGVRLGQLGCSSLEERRLQEDLIATVQYLKEA